jgi:hypothetical protein
VACMVAPPPCGGGMEAALKGPLAMDHSGASLQSEDEGLRQLFAWRHELGARRATSPDKDLRQLMSCVTLSGYAR